MNSFFWAILFINWFENKKGEYRENHFAREVPWSHIAVERSEEINIWDDSSYDKIEKYTTL